MPQRYITIPEPITLKDPKTKEPLKKQDGSFDMLSFSEFLHKVMFNPMWNQTVQNIKAADAINKAFDGAKDGVMVLAEEDWKKLESAVQNPVQQLITQMGAQNQPGFGYHPTLTPQLLPLIDAVLEAHKDDPRIKS